MITRKAAVRELTRRTLPGGAESCAASVTFDEAGATTLRLSREEHDEIAALMRGGSGFVVCLRPAAPGLAATTPKELLTNTKGERGI